MLLISYIQDSPSQFHTLHDCMDNIDQVNMGNQLPEGLIQMVLPDVEKENDVYEHVMSQPTEDVIKSKAVTGRNIKMVWTDFTGKLETQKVSNGKTAICKHCQITVTHHNKNLSVQTHMKSCKPFVSLMNCTAEQEKPEWYKELKSLQKKQSASKSRAASNLSKPAKLMKSSDIRIYGVPKLTNGEMKKVESCLAILYYFTGTLFHRIEEAHLLETFQTCRNDIK